MLLPTVSKYCRGANNTLVTIGELELYFSYETLVAVRTPKELVCIKNYWGPTTGRHINAIQFNKEKRLSEEEFNKRVEELLS